MAKLNKQTARLAGLTSQELAEGFRHGTEEAARDDLAAGIPVYGSFNGSDVYAVLPEPNVAKTDKQTPGTSPESHAS